MPECISIDSEDSDHSIQKPEVQAILQELANLKRKEADCYERLVTVILDMTDEEIMEVGERIWPSKLPKCAEQLFDRLQNLKNFRTVLAVGERIFSFYNNKQTGEPITEVSELCEQYDIRKTKFYEMLHGGRYGKGMPTPKPENTKPARQVKTLKLEKVEETPQGQGRGKESS